MCHRPTPGTKMSSSTRRRECLGKALPQRFGTPSSGGFCERDSQLRKGIATSVGICRLILAVQVPCRGSRRRVDHPLYGREGSIEHQAGSEKPSLAISTGLNYRILLASRSGRTGGPTTKLTSPSGRTSPAISLLRRMMSGITAPLAYQLSRKEPRGWTWAARWRRSPSSSCAERLIAICAANRRRMCPSRVRPRQ